MAGAVEPLSKIDPDWVGLFCFEPDDTEEAIMRWIETAEFA